MTEKVAINYPLIGSSAPAVTEIRISGTYLFFLTNIFISENYTITQE